MRANTARVISCRGRIRHQVCLRGGHRPCNCWVPMYHHGTRLQEAEGSGSVRQVHPTISQPPVCVCLQHACFGQLNSPPAISDLAPSWKMHHGKGISAESNLISVSSWQDFYSGAVSAKLVSLSVLSSRIIGLILSKGDLNYKSFKDMYNKPLKTTVTSQTKEIPFLFLFLHLDCVKWGPDQTLESIELLDSLNKHLSRCCLED